MSEGYFILPDFHLNIHKENRFSYAEEAFSVCVWLGETVDKYRDRGIDKLYGISVGDLVDIGHSKRANYVAVQQLIKIVLRMFDDLFLNFGNHEITFYKDNPLFSFIRDIQHPHIISKFGHLKCESSFNEIKTPERIILNDTEIVFRGWGTESVKITDKRGILILHTPLLSSEGARELYATNQYEEVITSLDSSGYEDIYCGHIHTVIDTWDYHGATVHNLGSLLRTSVQQIDDFNRRRVVPVLIFDDNRNLIEKNEEILMLHERSLIVDEESVLKGQIDREDVKDRKDLKRRASLPNLFVEDPVAQAQQIFADQNDQLLLDIFSKLQEGRMPLWSDYTF